MVSIQNAREIIHKKIHKCGKPQTVAADRENACFQVIHQTCKQVYCCDYCQVVFQREFTNDVKLLAEYAAVNAHQLLFITLTFKPIPVEELAEFFKIIRKSFNSLNRRRIQPRSIRKIFNRAVADYKQSVEKYKNDKDKEKRKIFLNADHFIELQNLFLTGFLNTLPESDARFCHSINKGLARLEIKIKSKGYVYPHIHALVAVPAGIPKILLSRMWEDASGSKIVDIEPVHDAKKAAYYVAKYISKAPGESAIDHRETALAIQEAHRGRAATWWFGSDRKPLKKETESKLDHVATIGKEFQDQTPKPGETFAAKNYEMDINFEFNYTSSEQVVTFDVQKSKRLHTLKQAKNKFRAVISIEDMGKSFRITRRAGKWLCVPAEWCRERLEEMFLGISPQSKDVLNV